MTMSATEKHTVAVIMNRGHSSRGAWSVPNWSAVSVMAGEHLAAGRVRRRPLRADDDNEQYLWAGLTLTLYADRADGYWYNLVGETPSLFVICHEAPDGELEPFRVTADHDEAAVGLEGDDQVFSVPIPSGLYQSIEQFVVAHYVPRAPKKRKRKNWSGTPSP